ncbi:hypothetical protein BH11BAC7_BH11BAC7_01950 [soil metagenome]
MVKQLASYNNTTTNHQPKFFMKTGGNNAVAGEKLLKHLNLPYKKSFSKEILKK